MIWPKANPSSRLKTFAPIRGPRQWLGGGQRRALIGRRVVRVCDNMVFGRLNFQSVNTCSAMIIPFYPSQFLGSIPKDLDEEVPVDGTNYWQILWRVIPPNCMSAIATPVLTEFQFIWYIFYYLLTATSSLDLQVFQVTIASQSSDRQAYRGRTLVGLVSDVLPVALLFLFGRRFYFRSAVLSGMK